MEINVRSVNEKCLYKIEIQVTCLFTCENFSIYTVITFYFDIGHIVFDHTTYSLKAD